MAQNRSTSVMQRRVESRQSLDDFPTPPWATRALIEEVIGPRMTGGHVCLRSQNAWDPACGRGHMSAAMAEYFFAVHGSDVADYSEDAFSTQHRVADFLGLDAVPPRIEKQGVDWIITNPPFRLASEFIRRALALRPRMGVAMLTRLAFIEGVERHRSLFGPHPPTTVAQFAERVPILKGRVSATGSTATAYCWLLWDTTAGAQSPPTQLTWIQPCRRRLERKTDYPETRSVPT